MKLLIVSGSRNPEGQTAQAAAALARGAESAGCETETVFLPQLNIQRCRQCDQRGWGQCRSEGECVIKEDDFAGIAEKIRSADVLAFANPVYFSDLSESLRAFLDRLRRIMISGKRDDMKGKPAVGVCVAGGGGGGAPKCTVSLEWTLATCGFDVVDMVPARRQNLDMKITILPAVGKWLASGPAS